MLSHVSPPHLWDVNLIFLISCRWCNWIMKQFYPGHTANKFSIIPFFMESCRQLQYISLTAGAISGTQISRIQTILHTVDHPTATDRGKMWGHFKWRFLRAGFLFTQETVLDIGPAPILPFYCFLLSTRVSFFSWPSVPSKPEKTIKINLWQI